MQRLRWGFMNWGQVVVVYISAWMKVFCMSHFWLWTIIQWQKMLQGQKYIGVFHKLCWQDFTHYWLPTHPICAEIPLLKWGKIYIQLTFPHCCVECLPILYEIPLLLSFKASYLVNYYFDLYFVERQSPRIESTYKAYFPHFWGIKIRKTAEFERQKDDIVLPVGPILILYY